MNDPLPERPPDFLVIGAQKAGTTWLYLNLMSHPGVWVPPVKELNYLNQRFMPSADGWEGAMRLRRVREAKERMLADRAEPRLRASWQRAVEACDHEHLDDAAYCRIFGCAEPGLVCGEVSPEYALLPPEAVRHVARLNPALRILMILRDPLQRALSHISMAFRDGTIGDPSRGLSAELIRGAIARSDYPAAIERWRAALPTTSLHLLSYEQLRDEPLALLERACHALGACLDVSVFSNSSRVVFRGEPSRVHPDAVALIANALGPIYERMREIAPEIASRWTR